MPRGRPRGAAGGSDKPRGRMTAYAFFVQTCCSEHKKLHPNETVQFVEFSRPCSERWKTMSDKEKKKFHDLAKQDKDRYILDMKDFVPVPGIEHRGRRGRGNKPPKDPNKPKRALSAFFYYANDERASVWAANPDFSLGEVAKQLGRQWTKLTETDKHKYEKLTEADRARYRHEMTAYKAGDEAPFKKIKAASGHPVSAVPDDDEEKNARPDEDYDDGSAEED